MRYLELFEKVIKLEKYHSTEEFIVLQNPTLTQIEEMNKRSKLSELRAIITYEDIFVWDSNDSYHEHVYSTLDIDNILFFTFWDKNGWDQEIINYFEKVLVTPLDYLRYDKLKKNKMFMRTFKGK